MRVGISTETLDAAALLTKVNEQPLMAGRDLVGEVTTDTSYLVPAVGDKRATIVAVDLGIKSMTPSQLAARGLDVHVVPAHTSFEQIAQLNPDGVFFSNGPGDPATATGPIDVLRQVLAAKLPYFGICFGNQLLGRALGFGTYKLPFGHRGINQPVMDRTTTRRDHLAEPRLRRRRSARPCHRHRVRSGHRQPHLPER